ncbi:MAG: FecR domain-containing protein [Kiritimatiellae bacterium]|nr:FecR domain-containing protein [Kiritimatiellia bacterium]
MPEPEQQPEASDLLVQGYLEGDLSDEECASLLARLAEDPGLAGEILSNLRTDAMIRDAIEESMARGAAEPVPIELEARERRRPPAPRMRRSGAPRRADARHAHRRGWGVTLIAASLLVALGALFNEQLRRLHGAVSSERNAQGAEPVARIERVYGQAHLSLRGRRQPAGAGATVTAGERLATTGPRDRAVVVYENRTRIELMGSTGVLFARPFAKAAQAPAGPAHVRLEAGTLAAEVHRTPETEAMRLATRHALITVVGTQFVLATTPETTRIEMKEGLLLVQATATGESAQLSAGTVATVSDRIALAEHAAPPARAQAVPRRTSAGLLVLYTFGEGTGRLVHDVGGAGLPLDLEIEDTSAVQWRPGGGLAVRQPTVIVSKEPARKITEACVVSDEITIEAWVRPKDMNPDPFGARIVSLSYDPMLRNFSLLQWHDTYAARIRTTFTDDNGTPQLATPAHTATGGLAHLVLTRDRSGVTHLYVNGADRLAGKTGAPFSDIVPETPVRVGGDFSNWSQAYRLLLAREWRGLRSESSRRHWLGEFRLVAVYNRALTRSEVAAHCAVGVPAEAGRQALHLPSPPLSRFSFSQNRFSNLQPNPGAAIHRRLQPLYVVDN